MIEKLTDFGILSGVSSPLLPLIYAEGVFSQNDFDGAFLQKSEVEGIQAIFSLKNTCVTLHLINTDGIEELENFFHFCGVREILSDNNLTQFCNSRKELNLLEFCGNIEGKNDCITIISKSTINEYEDIYNVVFEDGNNFENWFPEFSKKINSFNAFSTYLKVNDRAVSVAIAPAIYENFAIIAGVFTVAEYRKKGLASMCVKGLLKELKDNNISKIYLWCEDNNLPFYEKIGFKTIKKIYFGECK